jgi:hypothetical protein
VPDYERQRLLGFRPRDPAQRPDFRTLIGAPCHILVRKIEHLVEGSAMAAD